MKKNYKKTFIVTLLCSLIFFAGGQAWADEKGDYTILFKETETLYQNCKLALQEYKDKPDNIGNSICGIYVQGFLGGFTAGNLYTLSKTPDEFQREYIEKHNQQQCFVNLKSLFDFIENFIVWREQQKKFNDVSYSALYNSMLENENCQNIDIK